MNQPTPRAQTSRRLAVDISADLRKATRLEPAIAPLLVEAADKLDRLTVALADECSARDAAQRATTPHVADIDGWAHAGGTPEPKPIDPTTVDGMHPCTAAEIGALHHPHVYDVFDKRIGCPGVETARHTHPHSDAEEARTA